MDPLQQFYENKAMSAAVQQYLYQTLQEKALEEVFGGGAVFGYPEAKKILDAVFIKLRQAYEPQPKANTTNKAR